MVVFRVDSNSMIGKSHMYRCLAIAKAIKLMGKEVLFVCREDSDVSDIQKSFLDYRLVPSMRLGSDEAINILKDIINEVQEECYSCTIVCQINEWCGVSCFFVVSIVVLGSKRLELMFLFLFGFMIPLITPITPRLTIPRPRLGLIKRPR